MNLITNCLSSQSQICWEIRNNLFYSLRLLQYLDDIKKVALKLITVLKCFVIQMFFPTISVIFHAWSLRIILIFFISSAVISLSPNPQKWVKSRVSSVWFKSSLLFLVFLEFRCEPSPVRKTRLLIMSDGTVFKSVAQPLQKNVVSVKTLNMINLPYRFSRRDR